MHPVITLINRHFARVGAKEEYRSDRLITGQTFKIIHTHQMRGWSDEFNIVFPSVRDKRCFLTTFGQSSGFAAAARQP